MNGTYWRLLFVTTTMTLAAGCGKAPEGNQQAGGAASETAATPQAMENLKALGLAFWNYHEPHERFPEDWEALIQFTQAQGQDAAPLVELRDAGCVVNGWALRIRDIATTVGTPNFALAYLPETAREGGPVLTADGAVIPTPAEHLQQMLQNQEEVMK